MARLALYRNALPVASFELRGGDLIGRDAQCDVLLSDRSVSRQHALILEREGSFFLRDLHSTAGTIVNQAVVVGERRLEAGDRIELGHAELVFLLGEVEPRIDCAYDLELPQTTPEETILPEASAQDLIAPVGGTYASGDRAIDDLPAQPFLNLNDALDPERPLVLTPAQSQRMLNGIEIRSRFQELEAMLERGEADEAIYLPAGFLQHVLERRSA